MEPSPFFWSSPRARRRAERDATGRYSAWGFLSWRGPAHWNGEDAPQAPPEAARDSDGSRSSAPRSQFARRAPAS
jgi:hypothetical protein